MLIMCTWSIIIMAPESFHNRCTRDHQSASELAPPGSASWQGGHWASGAEARAGSLGRDCEAHMRALNSGCFQTPQACSRCTLNQVSQVDKVPILLVSLIVPSWQGPHWWAGLLCSNCAQGNPPGHRQEEARGRSGVDRTFQLICFEYWTSVSDFSNKLVISE